MSTTTKNDNLTRKHCKDLFTDPLRISLLEELALSALTHPSLSCTTEGNGPAHRTILSSRSGTRRELLFQTPSQEFVTHFPRRTHSFIDSSKDQRPAPLSDEAVTCFPLNKDREENFQTFRMGLTLFATRKSSGSPTERIFTCSFNLFRHLTISSHLGGALPVAFVV